MTRFTKQWLLRYWTSGNEGQWFLSLSQFPAWRVSRPQSRGGNGQRGPWVEETELRVQEDQSGLSLQERVLERRRLHKERTWRHAEGPSHIFSWEVVRTYWWENSWIQKKNHPKWLGLTVPRAHIGPISTSQTGNSHYSWGICCNTQRGFASVIVKLHDRYMRGDQKNPGIILWRASPL